MARADIKLSSFCCAVAAALCASSAAGQAHDAHAGHSADAAAMDTERPYEIVVDFELADRDGNLVRDEDFRGRYLLVGFGFTHCAHICPLMALNMGRVLRDSDRDAAGVFVSVDTERDPPAVTDDYASNFGEAMMGLGGTLEQVNTAAKNFKVSYAVTKTQNNYTVQHTANVYLIDPEGVLLDIFTFSTQPDVNLEAMR